MWRLVALLVLLSAQAALAADASKPHPHTGTLEPFKPGPPPALTAAELSSLSAGKAVQKTVQMTGVQGARAIAVFDVPAPPKLVWECINDLKEYPRMVPGVSSMQIERTASLSGGGTQTLAKWTVAVLGYKLSYFLDLRYEPRHNTQSFRLDYSKFSDIDDTVGYWHVAPRVGPGGEAHSRVTYSAALTLRGWFPKSVIDFLMATTLGKATAWVTAESARRLPAGGGGRAASKRRCRWTWKGRRCQPADTAAATAAASAPPPPARRSWRILSAVICSVAGLLGCAYLFGIRA